MKRLLLSLSLCCIVFSIMAIDETDCSSNSVEMKQYQCGYFSMEYPADWEVIGTNLETIKEDVRYMIVLHNYLKSAPISEVNIIRSNKPRTQTTYELCHITLMQMQDFVDDMQLIKISNANLSGLVGTRIEVVWTYQGKKMRTIQYALKTKDNYVYTLSGVMEDKYTASIKKTTENILTSIKIK